MSGSTPDEKQAPYIRRATPADSPALSHICLVTADAGVSAAPLHSCGELPGLMYAEPYVHLPTGFGFVLVDPSKAESEQVVGYCLSTYDTRQFERDLVEKWFPPYREKYPLPTADSQVSDSTAGHLCTLDWDLTPNDKRFIALIHNPPTADHVCIAFSPAHLHIDILPEYQRQGWGRRLIGEAVRVLREKGLDGLWLGFDPRNENGKRFYKKIGFKEMPEAPGAVMSLKFADWKD